MSEFTDLVGSTVTGILVGDDYIHFALADRRRFSLYHAQDCCEKVYIESFVGDVADLLGTPLLAAEMSCNPSDPEGVPPRQEDKTRLWTFYKLATRKGYVDIRWIGESNGHYSVEVDFARLDD